MAPLKKKRIQIRKFPVTQYQADALKQLCPPENITVSEWAENYRVLDSKTSALPGPWRNDKTPYLKEIMDELINYDTERIIFVKPTQVGGTEALQNMLGYVIQQDPSPTMIVYPTDILAKSISENRLEPMIMATRTLKSLYNKNESSQLELQFDGMYLSLAGSNSPSSLASKAIKYLFLDEVDKYPGSSKKESDPISLAMERTKTFRNRKIYMTSTPTLATGHIWKAKKYTDTKSVKEESGYTSPFCYPLWPCDRVGEYILAKSAVAGAMIQYMASDNEDVPNQSPSNHLLGVGGQCLEDGTEVYLDQDQANTVNGYGVTTAINQNGYRLWGNYTGAYPASSDAKDIWFAVRRMFSWQGNNFIQTYFDEVDDPMNNVLVQSVVDSENIRCSAYAPKYWAGASIEYKSDDNPKTAILAGTMKFRQHIAPYTPAQEIVDIIDYDTDTLAAAVGGN